MSNMSELDASIHEQAIANLIGTPVISTVYDEPYTYGGEPDQPGWTRLAVNLRFGGATLSSDFDTVAPADTPVPIADPRVTIEKLPKKRSYDDAGVWLYHLDIPGFDGAKKRARKTKRDATAVALRTLAIYDWHQALSHS